MAKQLSVGNAECSITPETNMQLIHRVSVGVHDELFARTLACSSGEQRAAIVSLDLISISPESVEIIRSAVFESCGLPGACLFLCCSHTHSSPVASEFRGWSDGTAAGAHDAYLTLLHERVTKCVSEAFSNLEPVDVAYGDWPLQIGFNRRLEVDGFCHMVRNPDGPVDRRMRVIRFTPVGETNPKCLLYSHGCHPVVIHASTPWVSADYPGVVSAALKSKFGEQLCPIFIQGCAADVNSEVLDGSFEDLERIGAEAARAAEKAMKNSRPIECGWLGSAEDVVALPVHIPSIVEADAALQRAIAEEQSYRSASVDPTEANEYAACGVNWARQLVAIASSVASGNDATLDAENLMGVMCLAFGDELCLVGMQAELFFQYHDRVARGSPFKHTLTTSFVNGSVNYLPTAEEFPRGGYEVGASDYSDPILYAYKRYGTLKLVPECEQRVLIHTTQLLRQVKTDG